VRTLTLKIDVCTYEGLHRGVRPLLAVLARHDVTATFCLAFGPDNSGKALRNVFRPGFLTKMLRTGAPTTYGLRTMVSGTLLPARPIASAAPEILREIVAGGHEVALHGWDHRTWQDELGRLSRADIGRELASARDACAAGAGAAPRGTAAPGWIVTPDSLAAQDALGFAYASDLRGGPPCRLVSAAGAHVTPQIPTTGPCIEELLAEGVRAPEDLSRALLDGIAPADHAVFAVHAEVEGRAYVDFFDRLLPELRRGRDAVLRLEEVAARLAAGDLPPRRLVAVRLPGRPGEVASSAPLGGDDA